MITCPRCDGVGKVNFGNIAGRICFLCEGVGQVKENKTKKRFHFKFVNFPNIPVHCVTIDALTEEKAFDKARQDLIKRKNAKGYIEHGIDAENEPIFIFDSYLL